MSDTQHASDHDDHDGDDGDFDYDFDCGAAAVSRSPLRRKPRKYIVGWLSEPHTELVERVYDLLFGAQATTNPSPNPHCVVCVVGPHGIGKTALLRLLEHHLGTRGEMEFVWHRVQHSHVPEGIEMLGSAAFAVRRDARIELIQQLTDLQPPTATTMHIVAIDDAHQVFAQSAFWTALQTAAHTWLPPNVRFIVAATTSATAYELPSPLASFPRITRNDLLLSHTRARTFLVGGGGDKGDDGDKDEWLRGYGVYVELLLRASNGNIGLLEELADATDSDLEKYKNNRTPSESKLVQRFFSTAFSKCMSMVLAPGMWDVYTFPIRTVSSSFACVQAQRVVHAQPMMLESSLELTSQEELLARGLLVLLGSDPAHGSRHSDQGPYRLQFASPCAQRVALALASDRPTDDRPLPIPTTPSALVHSILAMIPAFEPLTNSGQTAVELFVQHFLEALKLVKNDFSEIYPELKDVFPVGSTECTDMNPHDDSTIEMDIYYVVHESLRWGLQLRITTADATKSLASPPDKPLRFERGQRYDALCVDDFVAADIVLVPLSAPLVKPEEMDPRRMVVHFRTAPSSFLSSASGRQARMRTQRNSH